MTNHTLKKFDRDLEQIKAELNELASIVLKEFEQAIDIFDQPNTELADNIVAQDRIANQCLSNIEQHGARVLARQHAVADDLRFILSSMRIAPRLERVGDYAKSMAVKSSQFKQVIPDELNEIFHQMHLHLVTMLRSVIEAYNTKNATQANVVWEGDDTLDAYYRDVYTRLIQGFSQQTTSSQQLVELLFIAKGLERAGDHISDIATDVQFMVNGA
ncbi:MULTISPECIES: phosphate signaling complex protein PhoU [unclassified Vibrio]|uniref:phosphate signaling complex protein PhoU n=1 Tax=unclassified Vibrio TaxID=2614977 RepID=UPI0025579132|nr:MULTISPECIES: phosphate signaling complex protein PhoU [unclassified Vibrio]EKA2632554.1 phosphate signaling complex protein PhoU [Vibrio alginolyticus]ELA7354269.1 phosphate signaling complex protein PhoU [Vibrio alginolyticus]ELA8177014.1 phosphate signaling complex protein PhoU [Vibrio alginolyticus]ELA9731548.1 phosphate signaling complex protein PhoU [Vibrio alginolyticus]ELB2902812.1 phosphate signaling complex protein PhoU [Vibrio alginolyticus]